MIAASLLGWWTFTRRNEIGQRSIELAWQVLDREAKAVFAPLGWWVETAPGSDEVHLQAAPHYRAIQDEALAPVRMHGSVTLLSIRSDQVTDAGLEHLRGASRLRWIYLESGQITDAGVFALCELPRLRYLQIQSPHLSGRSLQALAKVNTLRYLVIRGGRFSSEEVAAFRAARPGVDLRVEAQ